MKQNPLTQSRKICETYLSVKGEKFVRNSRTGYFNHPQLDVDQSVMSWLHDQGWIEVQYMNPPKTFCNIYTVI
jgi:hypothetical protein